MASPPRFAAIALLALAACNKAPAEPAGSPASSQAPPPAVAPLEWDAPPTWARLDVPAGTDQRAAYRVEGAGHDAEVQAGVYFFGTGSKGDPARNIKDWFDHFDGDVGKTAARQHLQVNGLDVEIVEVSGTYKVALTPTPRGRKQAPVQMVKDHYRLCGAVVKTPDRGNWFFRLVGPDESVQRARSSFRAMVESVR